MIIGIGLNFGAGYLCAAPTKEWITLENCQLISNPSNDGDSFHIRANDTEYLLRLYLVDAPETESVGPARLIEQAQYFGISVPQVIEIGEKAKLFTQAKLSEPFTVLTRKASGLGRSKIERFYGFVRTKDGDLGELLVANGLARVHGTRAAPPGASSAAEEVQKLEQLEQQAKQAKLGGWNLNAGLTASAPTAEPKTTPVVTPIARMAQPESFAPTATAIPRLTQKPPTLSSSSAPTDTTKLDINTATKEQLEKVPGIGPKLADAIIAARPFKSADDLKKVRGFGGGKRYEEARRFFR